jgi:CubicO group peptidase (beta-lactamase class C family)
MVSCQRSEQKPEMTEEVYFPTNSEWEKIDKSTIGIDDKELKELNAFLVDNNTRAFLILKNGRIVVEEYFGQDLLKSKNFDKNSQWYWASAGKGLTAYTVGLAQEKGFLNINDITSKYLGENWTSLSKSKEDLITIKHQLSMTSGLDSNVPDSHCFAPECLKYKADAGSRWDYHNGPYTLLDKVIASAIRQNFEDFFEANLKNKIGMDGFWRYVDNDHVYFSTPRSFARFGVMMLNNGDWDGKQIMNDKTYFNEMVETSQNRNQAYGYLWWLNGKETGMVPTLQQVFKQSITPNAPKEMYAAMGKNGQLLNIVPSQKLILVRMGDAPGDQIGLTFQQDLWTLLSKMMN